MHENYFNICLKKQKKHFIMHLVKLFESAEL